VPVIAKEFHPHYQQMLTLAQNIGLLVGAVFWGFGCDIFGRRWAFNLTLGVTAVFGMISAGSPTFAGIGCFCALWSFGVGGNLPVDSAVFLEFLPGTHQYLLTILSIDWAVAQVITTLIAWPLLGYRTCKTKEGCTRSENMGWRYFVIIMGGLALISFAIRFLAFTIYESPKYLMGKGKDEEAVQVVHEVARRNGKTVNLTLEDLKACEPEDYVANTNAEAAVRRNLEKVNLRPLFSTRRMALSTSLIMVIWAFIGLGYPLYNAFLPSIIQNRLANEGPQSIAHSYRDSLIIATLGVPGALLGGLLVEFPYLGRRGVLGGSTVLTGVFLYASTTAHTGNALLGWNCAYNFFSTILYAVLYAYTPEVFPTIHRGTGNALTATANRVFGIMAPIISMYADLNTPVPVYVSGGLFIVAGLLCFLLPYESRGKASI
jgi:MFS family permease